MALDKYELLVAKVHALETLCLALAKLHPNPEFVTRQTLLEAGHLQATLLGSRVSTEFLAQLSKDIGTYLDTLRENEKD